MLKWVPLQSLARIKWAVFDTVLSMGGMGDLADTRGGAPTAPMGLSRERRSSGPVGGFPWLLGCV